MGTELKDLINNIRDGENVKAGKEFDSIMKEKLSSALDAEKIKVASSMVGEPVEEPVVEEPVAEEPVSEPEEENELLITLLVAGGGKRREGSFIYFFKIRSFQQGTPIILFYINFILYVRNEGP